MTPSVIHGRLSASQDEPSSRLGRLVHSVCHACAAGFARLGLGTVVSATLTCLEKLEPAKSMSALLDMQSFAQPQDVPAEMHEVNRRNQVYHPGLASCKATLPA